MKRLSLFWVAALVAGTLSACAIGNVQMPPAASATQELALTQTYTPKPATATYTSRPNSTATRTLIPTTPVYNIEGFLFEDPNYNGIQDEGEEAVSGVEVCLDLEKDCVPVDEVGKFKITSNTEDALIYLKQPLLEEGKVKYNFWTRYDGKKTIPAFENIPEQVLDVTTHKPISTTMDINVKQLNQLGLIEDEIIKGLCPVKGKLMTKFGVPMGHKPGGHTGIDISNKYGTRHVAPENGSYVGLGIDLAGGQYFYYMMETGMYLRMNHLDFKYNDYATFRFFGLDSSIMFDENGKIKSSLKSIEWVWDAIDNGEVFRGQILPLYMGLTGNQTIVHTHIEVMRNVSTIIPFVNPCFYLDCCGSDW